MKTKLRLGWTLLFFQVVLCEDLSHLPLEHRGGDVVLPPNSGPLALPQRAPLYNNKRQTQSAPIAPTTGDNDDIWPSAAQSADQPQIQDIQVQCEKTSVRVNIKFDRPFYGMVFSKGFYSDPKCVHLAAGSGTITASFEIFLNQCGMTSSGNTENYGQPNPAGSFVESTVIIQYDPLVQEVWDQARKLRCTWYDYYEKSVTFRPFQVDMINAVTANFLGDNLQCWMQIQVGKGPWSSEVSGIVKIGQTMTMVLGIKDDENKFDMLVRNCVAHDGKRSPIQLVDELGCVTRPKIMSNFQKMKNFGSSASVVSYAYFQAFKFPDSMNVHFQCVIQVCRFNCPDPVCGGGDIAASAPGTDISPASTNYGGPNERSFNVDPRVARPAGLVIGEDQFDQLLSPEQQKPVFIDVGPQGSRRRDGPIPPKGINTIPIVGRAPRVNAPPPAIPDLKRTIRDLLKRKAMKDQEQLRRVRRESEDVMSTKARQEKEGRPTLKRIYKRAAQEMADIETNSVIQVLSPGDVAFTLGSGNDTTVVLNSSEWDQDNICMSWSSLVGGLVMLIGVLLVAGITASCMHCSSRKKKKQIK